MANDDEYWKEIQKQIAENMRKQREDLPSADKLLRDAAQGKKIDDARKIHEQDQRANIQKLARGAKRSAPKKTAAKKSKATPKKTGCLVWVISSLSLIYGAVEAIKSI